MVDSGGDVLVVLIGHFDIYVNVSDPVLILRSMDCFLSSIREYETVRVLVVVEVC